jgi:hypothetical protein
MDAWWVRVAERGHALPGDRRDINGGFSCAFRYRSSYVSYIQGEVTEFFFYAPNLFAGSSKEKKKIGQEEVLPDRKRAG